MKPAGCNDVLRHLTSWIDGAERESIPREALAHLEQCPECRALLDELSKTVALLRRLPAREPVLDLWSEMAPAMADARRDQRRGPVGRLRHRARTLLSNAAAGAIVFTDQVARNTDTALRRWMLQDPFHRGEEA